MRPLALLLLTLATGPGPLDTFAVCVHHFATLTDAEARQLDGRQALFLVRLDGDTEPEERDGWLCCDCEGEGEPLRCLYLHAGCDLADTMTVRATLRVRHHPALVGADGSAGAADGVPP
jgi:hypothetical protein